MEFKILDAAEVELRAATRYYDAELPGLGLDLTEEFAQVLKRILAHPQAGPPVATGIPPPAVTPVPLQRLLSRRWGHGCCPGGGASQQKTGLLEAAQINPSIRNRGIKLAVIRAFSFTLKIE
jgi:hypothetical protein